MKKQYQTERTQFHENQWKAITHINGPALVLAGPGSGKTTVITQRILHLIQTAHIDPAQILVITFTKAAAEEMKTRFMALADEAYPVIFGTFHSVFFRILQQSYHYTSHNIIRESEKNTYIRTILADTVSEAEQTQQMTTALLSEISIVKSSSIPPEEYRSAVMESTAFVKLYEAYTRYMKAHGKIDFDDMVLQCHHLLTSRKDVLAEWQRMFSYILIDEFQDSSYMQYALVRMLAEPENNLFVVGDDDQSIYSFRGARPEIMQLFRKDYSDAACITLDQNYRSTEEIVSYAGKLIRHNTERFPKQIQAAGKSGAAQSVVVQAFADEKEEYAAVVDELGRRLLQKNLYDTAVIYRTNKEAAYLTERLTKAGIPFHMKEKIVSMYQTQEARDIFAYMQFAKTPARGLFYRIMNKPSRYISRGAVQGGTVRLEELSAYYRNNSRMREQIMRLWQQIQYLAKLSPYAAVMYIRRGIGYDYYLMEQADGYGKERALEEVERLSERAKEYDTLEEWQQDIRKYEEKLRREESSKTHSKESVSIITMHGAKGLEYETVYIPDLNEGIIPHKKSLTKEALAEERRMLYVAMTRAKKRLYLYYVDGTDGRKIRSRFLKEIIE